jgi:hypothetical protein
MAPNRITRGVSVRRAPLLAAVGLAIAILLGACGGGGGGTATTATDKEADAEVLNEILSRQSAAVTAYDTTLPALRGRNLALARLFRAQEQEHEDAILKALRGIGEASEPAPETIEADELESEAEHLVFLYELESATIEAELTAVAKLTEAWPRSLLASTVANQAQHLVLLRRALGAKPLDTVPVPFENGTAAAP